MKAPRTKTKYALLLVGSHIPVSVVGLSAFQCAQGVQIWCLPLAFAVASRLLSGLHHIAARLTLQKRAAILKLVVGLLFDP